MAVIVVIAGLWVLLQILMAPGIIRPHITVNTRLVATQQSVVGGTSEFSLTVTNTGPEIKNFLIYANTEGADNWFQHHAVVDSGSCRPDPSRGTFACGPIAEGATATFTIRGRPTGTGRFYYMLNYADARGGDTVPVTPRWPWERVPQDSWYERVTS